jgi:P27 family predicted phage terminase small subunit
MNENELPKPPTGLSKTSQALWRTLVADWDDFDEICPQVALKLTLEALDRLTQAQTRIEKDGLTFTDRHGVIRSHPLLAVERDCRAAIIRGLKALGLKEEDLEPKRKPGRPSESEQRYRATKKDKCRSVTADE